MFIQRGKIKNRPEVPSEVKADARHKALWGSLAESLPIGDRPDYKKVVEAAGCATCGDNTPGSEQE